MRRTAIRVLTALALATGGVMVAGPAQADVICDQPYRHGNAVSVYCGGGQGQYRAEVTCRSDWNARTYSSVGPWRWAGGSNASTARCDAGDFLIAARIRAA
ncbi:hypothetical protein ICW40_09225 [Actinotalea ferrariae]|uniref:hypothetical protein n=1 Tax=Actinotalea ferrariae TaxID=1386098 RepID=UPI001C8C2705|nr:hypothetical protein [Actinotalea ferrariae]MBX9244990.1 hypothetical protein [Actinotalea ferrariae]